MKPNRLFALATLAVAGPSFADTPTVGPDEIIVTATRSSQALSETLRDVTVITRQEIAAAGQSTLLEVLQARGNLEIISNGGMGQPSGVFIRGANANQTLVLVDGMRINSATTGTTAFENLPIDQIDRIEILRGPGSSLYGADAIGGVIQIFTTRGTGAPRVGVTLGAGSYDTQIGNARVSGTTDKVNYALQVGRTQSSGFSATNPDVAFGQYNPDRDGYTNTNVTGRVGYLFNADNEIGASALHSDGRTHFDSGPDSDDINHQQLSTYSVFSRNQLASGWQSQLRWSKSEDDSVVTGAFPGQFRTDQRQATWQNNFSMGWGELTAGIEQLDQHVTSDTQYTVTDRTTRSAFASYTGSFGLQRVELNARNDHDDQFGGRTTGLASYAYQFQPAWKAVASWGTAFKAPTFNDLYFPEQFGFGGNPDLKPERSQSIEAGVHFDQGTDHFSATYFDTHIHDLISISSDFSTVVNVDRARIQGLELNYRGQVAGLTTYAGVTFQKPVDEATGQLLPRRSRQHADLGISGKFFGDFQLGAETVLSGQRYDGTPNTSDNRLAGYAVVNLTAAYPFARNWLVRARLNNMLDQHYELAQGYNTPGRNLFVSVDCQFN